MNLCKIHIERFRGIKDQTILDIGSALPLIGKNNAGKSAILAAIRTLWGDYSPTEKDFYKSSENFIIEACFSCDMEYLLDYFYDNKVGVMKIPSTASEYNSAKDGTIWDNISFSDYKESRQSFQDSEFRTEHIAFNQCKTIWMNSLVSRLGFQDGLINITASCNKLDYKITYDRKDIISILPTLAFIDDSRNFEEEEIGKAHSVTSNIFNLILNTELTGDVEINTCNNCSIDDCEGHCIHRIQEKQILDLSIEELQKIINYKAKNASNEITNKISHQFENNYQPDYRIKIKATSNVNKSFSISTKIFDPALGIDINLSNVGAGVRSVYILSLLQAYQDVSSKHTVFMIEEPELYLHPQLQKSMANTLRKISEKNQVFFTTHSPIMLKEFNSSDIRKVKLDETNYYTICEVTTLDDILNEIGYSSQDVLNTDFVIFVEGPDDKEIIQGVLLKYYNINLERISIIDTKSCTNIGFYATLRFLNKTTMSNNFAIIRDADTKSHTALKQKLLNQLSENISPDYVPTITDNIYITKYSSIEGFIFSVDILLNHNIFASPDTIYNQLQRKLTEQKQKHIQYFNKQNSGNHDRILQFEEIYDQKVSDIQNSMEWVKENIRGHDYFGYTNSTRIAYSNYIEELPETAFQDMLDFFDTISFFSVKRRHLATI